MRDDVEENGGVALYSFLKNSPVYDTDTYGRCPAVLIAPVAGWVAISAVEKAILVTGGIYVMHKVYTEVRGFIITKVIEKCSECVPAEQTRVIQTRKRIEPKTQKGCPPCVQPLNPETKRTDPVPPGHAHFPCTGTHTHIIQRVVLQSPFPQCKCFLHERNVGLICH